MANITVHDRFKENAPWERILFQQDQIFQSAEANEGQSLMRARLRAIADALFGEGDLVRAAGIVVNATTGETVCQAGKIYAAGAVRDVPAAALTIPVAGDVNVGVYLRSRVITAIDDPTLLNPASGTFGYMQAGAAREIMDVNWGLQGDGQTGNFYPIWLVEDGIVRPKEPPPTLSAVTRALEGYDRDSAGGLYIVRGLSVTQLPDLPTGEQVYSLAEGAARVGGRSIELPTARRVVYNAQPDLLWVDSEPHQSTGEAPQRINVHRWPMMGVPQVRITARRTVNINHGGFTGAADALPDEGVIQLELVKQGSTTYATAADYVLTAGQVDWSPGGAEPAPGSTYEATYRYMLNVAPVDVDATGFTVSGALAETLVLVSYNYALRRIDRLCMNMDGSIGWTIGTPSTWSPVAPQLPPNTLALASVLQFWDERRSVRPDGDRMVPMSELREYRRAMDRTREDLAELRLAVDIQGRQSGIKKGLYADPFLSDEMRDAGQPQTAVIAGGALLLPIDFTLHQIGADITARQAPAHTHSVVIAQPLRTGEMLVNPYLAVDPLPADVVLKPAVDRWSETENAWASPILDVKVRVFYLAITERRPADQVETRLLSESTSELQYLRSIDVEFDLGFPPGETLASITFDGLPVVASPLPGGTLVADANSRLRGKFTIPPGIPSGSKLVRFVGLAGTTGSATFTGQGTLVHRELQQITTRWVFQVDPLSQTFTPPRAFQSSGVDLRFTAKGTSKVLVQLRTAEYGQPSQDVLAQVELKAAEIHLDGPTRAAWAPVLLSTDREYCYVVLTDDTVTAVGIAETGKWDPTLLRQVTSQPYPQGVLSSSSNTSSWSHHQNADMTFALLGAEYTEAERVIDLGSVEVVDATDLLVQGHIHQPSAQAMGEFELLLTGGERHLVSPGQVARLASRYTGPVQVNARLRSADGLGAVLEPGMQLVACSLLTSGVYTSPLINGGANARVRVVFEADLPAGTSLQIHVQPESGGAWIVAPFLESSPQTAGSLEITHELPSINAPRLRVRLTIGGAHNARPVLRNLRVIVL